MSIQQQVPAVYDLDVYKGSYFLRKFIYKVGGTPADLTGYTVRAQIRSSYNSPDVINMSCTIPDPTNGEIILEIPATTSTPITMQCGVWDMELLSNLGEPFASRIVNGVVKFYAEVTKV